MRSALDVCPIFIRVYGEIHALSVFDPSGMNGAAEVAVVGAVFR